MLCISMIGWLFGGIWIVLGSIVCDSSLIGCVCMSLVLVS